MERERGDYKIVSLCLYFLFFSICFKIYLAVPGLSWAMWDLVPWPRIKQGPLNWELEFKPLDHQGHPVLCFLSLTPNWSVRLFQFYPLKYLLNLWSAHLSLPLLYTRPSPNLTWTVDMAFELVSSPRIAHPFPTFFPPVQDWILPSCICDSIPSPSI